MKKFIAVLALASIIPAFAEEYKFDTPEAWQSHWQFKKDGERLLVTGQKWMIGKKLIKLPEGTTIDAAVVITIGDGTVTYPLVDCAGNAVTAGELQTRTRYALRVATTPTGGSFRLATRVCNSNNLDAITG
jgi:hypothetical protein